MKVLFVCTGNACRSPLAEALMKKFKLGINVDSAGIMKWDQKRIIRNEYPKIFETTKKYLEQEKAEQYLKKASEGLDNKQLDEYDIIVAMESKHKDFILKKCSKCASKIVVWNIDDPWLRLGSENVPREYAEKIFDQIKDKVRELADSI